MSKTWDLENLEFSPERLSEFLSTLTTTPLSFIDENSFIWVQGISFEYYLETETFQLAYDDRLSFASASLGLHLVGNNFDFEGNDFGIFGPNAVAMILTDSSTGETGTVQITEKNDVFQNVTTVLNTDPDDLDLQIERFSTQLFSGDDLVLLGDHADELSSGAGHDTVYGAKGDDTLYGGDGRDEIDGGLGGDVLNGGKGGDYLYGRGENDLISGGAGADDIAGGQGDDTLKGGSGDDSIYDWGRSKARGVNDILRGGSGDDYLSAGTGRDKLFGGSGDDTLIGGRGRDKLFGGTGNDEIHAGSYFSNGGEDTLVFEEGGGHDTVYEFDLSSDVLEFRGFAGREDDFTISEIKRRIVIEIDDSSVTLIDVANEIDVTTDDLLLT